MIVHQIEALAAAGVTDIVLAVNYRPEIMTEALKKYEKEYNVNIEFSVETEPLGTAGPLKLAEKILGKDDAPFFVLNSDVICDFPFQKLAEFHKAHGQEGTIVVTKVEEPSKYGVVVHRPDHPSRIDRFVEKPVEFVGNRINAGIYILNPSVLNRIELRPTSIEQETFPAIVKDGGLHSFDLEGFWMDVGQPKDFLSGTCLYLSSLTKQGSKLLTPASEPYVYGGNVMIDPTAKIGKNCKIGPNVVIGPNVEVGEGVRLQRSVLLKNCKIKEHAWVKSTIVGWNSTVGRWARMENVSVLGDDVTIGDEIYCNGASVLPHKSIKANVDSKLRPAQFCRQEMLTMSSQHRQSSCKTSTTRTQLHFSAHSQTYLLASMMAFLLHTHGGASLFTTTQHCFTVFRRKEARGVPVFHVFSSSEHGQEGASIKASNGALDIQIIKTSRLFCLHILDD